MPPDDPSLELVSVDVPWNQIVTFLIDHPEFDVYDRVSGESRDGFFLSFLDAAGNYGLRVTGYGP